MNFWASSVDSGNDRNLGLLYNLVGIETLPLNLASACGSAFYGRAAPRRSSIVLRPPRSERTRWSSPRGLPGRPPVPSRARAPCGVCVNSFDPPSRPSGDPGGPRRAESLATRSASAILASTLPTRNKTAALECLPNGCRRKRLHPELRTALRMLSHSERCLRILPAISGFCRGLHCVPYAA